jgi:hypothetical protein
VIMRGHARVLDYISPDVSDPNYNRWARAPTDPNETTADPE